MAEKLFRGEKHLKNVNCASDLDCKNGFVVYSDLGKYMHLKICI